MSICKDDLLTEPCNLYMTCNLVLTAMNILMLYRTFHFFNSNLSTGVVGKVQKDYLPKEEGREGVRGSNPGPTAC